MSGIDLMQARMNEARAEAVRDLLDDLNNSTILLVQRAVLVAREDEMFGANDVFGRAAKIHMFRDLVALMGDIDE
jgi:prophage DNA circulation protein